VDLQRRRVAVHDAGQAFSRARHQPRGGLAAPRPSQLERTSIPLRMDVLQDPRALDIGQPPTLELAKVHFGEPGHRLHGRVRVVIRHLLCGLRSPEKWAAGDRVEFEVGECVRCVASLGVATVIKWQVDQPALHDMGFVRSSFACRPTEVGIYTGQVNVRQALTVP
jgi:hypothetical protein